MINKTLRRLAVGAAAITVAGVVVPIAMAQTASAAEPTGITATPATQTIAPAGTATYTATLTPGGSVSQNGLYSVVTAGPGGFAANNTACTPAGPSGGPFTCTQAGQATAGTYTVTIYDDIDGSATLKPADPRTTVQFVVAGPAVTSTLAPHTPKISTATCQAYTITAKDAAGNPATGTDSVTISQTNGTAAAPVDPNLRFCTPSGAPYPNFPADTVGAKAPGVANVYSQTQAVTLTNGSGTFGVASDAAGTVTVSIPNTIGSTGDTTTETVDAGNIAAGPSLANDNRAATLALSPKTQNAIAGATVSETATVKNGSGDVLGGVNVVGAVTAGPNKGAAVTCASKDTAVPGQTDQTGTETCTYTATAAGSDTFVAWVNQNTHSTNTTGPDAGEPQDSATVTVSAALTAATLGNNCPGDTAGVAGTPGTGGTCPAAASAASTTVTFTLTSTVGGKTGTPAAGQTITFAKTGGSPADYVVSPASAQADANGQVTVTVSHKAGTTGTGGVTATFANGGTSITDTAGVNFVTPAASTVTITPPAQTAAVGATVTAMVTVTDQLKQAVPSVAVNYNTTSSDGHATPAAANGTCTTNSSGQCTITYTDNGPALAGAATRTDTITATIVGTGQQGTGTVTYVSGTAKAANVSLASSAGGANVAVTTDPATGKTAPVTTLTATVTDANGNKLQNDTVTFASSGVGTFTDVNGHPTNANTATAPTNAAGVATVYVRSSAPGTQTVTATADGVASNQVTVTYTNSQFTPVTPERVVDTRTNQGGLAASPGPLAPNTVYYFNLTSTDVPQGEAAYVFNVTAVHPSGAGNLRIGPSCAGTPTTSLINYQANADIANDVVVPNEPLGGGGTCDSFAIYSAGSATNVVIDLQGYYGQAAGFTGGNPARAVDTRSGLGGHSGVVAANTSASFTIAGVGGVPAVGSATPAKAVAINVTAIGPAGVGNLRVYPDGASVPTTSNINYIPGVDKAAFVVVQLPANGKIDVYSAGSSANVAIDVFGYYPNTSTVVTQTPVRVFDSRTTTELKAGTPVNVPVTVGAGAAKGVPTGSQAVLISLTAIHAADSTGVGNLRVYPAGQATPTISNINYISKTTDVANFAIVPIGSNGQISLYSAGSNINVAVDILGYVPATG